MASENVTFLSDRMIVTRTDGRMIIRTVLAIETYRRLFGAQFGGWDGPFSFARCATLLQSSSPAQ